MDGFVSALRGISSELLINMETSRDNRVYKGPAARVPDLQHPDSAWDAEICARHHFNSHRLSLSPRGHSGTHE